MKQRVKLAQALVHDPRLLFLDEPTNGLDPAGRDEMLDLVDRTGREFGIAVMVASHLLGEIERVGTCCWPSTPASSCGRRRSPVHRTHRQLLVEVEEGADALAERLVARGIDGARGRTHVLVDWHRPATAIRHLRVVRDETVALG